MLQNYIAHCELLIVNLLSHWNVWDLIIIDAQAGGLDSVDGTGTRCSCTFQGMNISHPYRPNLWPTQTLVYNVYRGSCAREKRQWRATDWPPIDSAAVKEIVELYSDPPSPPAMMACYWMNVN